MDNIKNVKLPTACFHKLRQTNFRQTDLREIPTFPAPEYRLKEIRRSFVKNHKYLRQYEEA